MDEITENPVHRRLLRQFAFEHLPKGLQAFSRPFAELAQEMVRHCIHDGLDAADTTVALRKLLEAKDAYVRAALD